MLAAEPNHVGSPHDKSNAEWILARFKEWGWDAHIETFEVLYPTPISETLETVGPKPFKATLQEPPIPGDSSATAKDYALPAYVAYQGDGDVTAPLVYVNYGMRDDYKTLERMGVSVKGKIVIARYGVGLARIEAAARAGAWRNRLHHLFRSRRTTVIPSTRPIPMGPHVRRMAFSAVPCRT